MGFYSEVIFPRCCDLLLNQASVGELRSELLAGAEGDILEIGFGTGLNLPYYPERVGNITTVDPNSGMHQLARKRIEQTNIQVDQRLLSGEQLPFENFSFDCVVSTFTLCSIQEVSQTLSEACRVLRRGGRFLFLEHGLSPDPGVQRWQHRLNWLQMQLGDGCRLNRNIRNLIAALPDWSVECDEFYLSGAPRTHGYLYRGVAVKA